MTETHTKGKVVVAMSGGVDSSAAAAILARDHEVVGMHMTKFDLPGLSEEKRAADRDSLESARRSAEIVGIPLRVVEAGNRFDGLVDYFCDAYNRGTTPNPCVRCNVTIKGRLLPETADAEGAQFVATGHYARIERRRGHWRLVRGSGREKDQTYFLHRLTERELSRTLFPLAEMTKADTRSLATEMGIPAVHRAESQEVCFVGAGGYREVLVERTPGAIRPGEVVDTEGHVLGMHEGYQYYTIGQRRGLRIALGEPRYVVAIDPETARVTLGTAADLEKRAFRVTEVNWFGETRLEPFEALVRIRYNHRGAPAVVTPRETQAEVEFAEPVKAVTPGQAAVFYVGDEVAGGGWIGA